MTRQEMEDEILLLSRKLDASVLGFQMLAKAVNYLYEILEPDNSAKTLSKEDEKKMMWVKRSLCEYEKVTDRIGTEAFDKWKNRNKTG